jgi:hypothetical protein
VEVIDIFMQMSSYSGAVSPSSYNHLYLCSIRPSKGHGTKKPVPDDIGVFNIIWAVLTTVIIALCRIELKEAEDDTYIIVRFPSQKGRDSEYDKMIETMDRFIGRFIVPALLRNNLTDRVEDEDVNQRLALLRLMLWNFEVGSKRKKPNVLFPKFCESLDELLEAMEELVDFDRSLLDFTGESYRQRLLE